MQRSTGDSIVPIAALNRYGLNATSFWKAYAAGVISGLDGLKLLRYRTSRDVPGAFLPYSGLERVSVSYTFLRLRSW